MKNWNPGLLSSLADLHLLSRVIARINEGKGVPALLWRYLGLNGKLVSFNVAPDCNDSLDGHDLRKVPRKTLGKFMGQEQAERYRSIHR